MMTTAATQPQPAADFQELKKRLKATWTTGDYGTFSRYMESDAAAFFNRLAIPPGARLLDVGCGAGQLSLIAARAGCHVTGCDIAPNWLEQARARARAEGLPIFFEEGDAESLPYLDNEFDVVASLIGAMFAPRPDAVAAELVRVCRPGGMIAMANWTGPGFIGRMFKVIARHIAPSGMPSPVLWGDPEVVRQRFGNSVSKLECTSHLYSFEYPFPPADVVEFFRQHYGPMTRAFAALQPAEQAELRQELVDLWSSANHAGPSATKVPAEYLQVKAERN